MRSCESRRYSIEASIRLRLPFQRLSAAPAPASAVSRLSLASANRAAIQKFLNCVSSTKNTKYKGNEEIEILPRKNQTKERLNGPSRSTPNMVKKSSSIGNLLQLHQIHSQHTQAFEPPVQLDLGRCTVSWKNTANHEIRLQWIRQEREKDFLRCCWSSKLRSSWESPWKSRNRSFLIFFCPLSLWIDESPS